MCVCGNLEFRVVALRIHSRNLARDYLIARIVEWLICLELNTIYLTAFTQLYQLF